MDFNDRSTPLSLLATRRSGKPRDMGEPGPSDEQIDQMIALAARTPDHGKLAPWRFVVVPNERRDAFQEVLTAAYRVRKPDAGRLEIEAIEQFAHQAPALIVALSSPRIDSSIPLWEQQLSAGAATMNLLHAAHAMGFWASWLTGWAAFDDNVRDAFGAAHERIAGFIFIGTAQRELSERPRPDFDSIASRWTS